MTKVAVLGSGAWGTTLAVLLANKGLHVTLWEHQPPRALLMQRDRVNAAFLPDIPLPQALEITADVATALAGADFVVCVTPSQLMRANARLIAPHISPAAVVITASKGLEVGSLARMTQVLQAELPPGPRDRLAALSGPNLAREVAEGKPAASVVAAYDSEVARQAQALFTTHMFRVYSTEDVVGVEIGGALKNVIAIAMGVSDSLGFGDNAKATLMTRGLAEIVRLAVAEGANPLTLAGLAGLGDLIATCSSTLSRNYSLGRDLTLTGLPLAEILAGRRTVAEGVMTARATVQMAVRHGLEMPITHTLCRLFDGEDARALVAALMQRGLRPERDIPQL